MIGTHLLPFISFSLHKLHRYKIGLERGKDGTVGVVIPVLYRYSTSHIFQYQDVYLPVWCVACAKRAQLVTVDSSCVVHVWNATTGECCVSFAATPPSFASGNAGGTLAAGMQPGASGDGGAPALVKARPEMTSESVGSRACTRSRVPCGAQTPMSWRRRPSSTPIFSR